MQAKRPERGLENSASKMFCSCLQRQKNELTEKDRLLMAPSPIGFHAWQPIIWEQSVSEGSYGIDGVKWNLFSF